MNRRDAGEFSPSYTAAVLRYAITDSRRFGTDFAARRTGLVEQARRLFHTGVDYIQLREKDLDAGELFRIAEAMLEALNGSEGTKLLINSRCDVAVAARAAGVHLTAHPDELRPEQVRHVFALAKQPAPFVSVSCHTVEEVERARENGANLILFGPVFEKKVERTKVCEGTGLPQLRTACEAAGRVPVLALGGVTPENADACMEADAAGIAGIHLFF